MTTSSPIVLLPQKKTRNAGFKPWRVVSNEYFKLAKTMSTGAFLTLSLTSCSDQLHAAANTLNALQVYKGGLTMRHTSVRQDDQASYPTVFKLSDQLVLQVPSSYLGTISSGPGLTPPSGPLENIPYAKLAAFTMFSPKFEGYSEDNWGNLNAGASQIIIQKIRLIQESEAVIFSKKRFFENIAESLKVGHFELPAEGRYGLRCHKWTNSDTASCFSETPEGALISISISTTRPGRTRLFASTFSKRYGGTQVQWSADGSQLSIWKDIDQDIWRKINAWNIAYKNTSTLNTGSGK